MAQTVRRIRVFVASPGDTQEERERLEVVVGEINRGIAAERGAVLELVRWETHVRPGIGIDAQAVINRQLPEVDIVVAVFWKRLGTPTPRAESGTAEEIENAIEAWNVKGEIEILTYFNQSPYTPHQDELDQIQRLLSFRERLKSSGVLVWNYDGVPNFEAQVREHLTAAVRDWPRRGRRQPAGGSLTEDDTPRLEASSSDRVEAKVDASRPGDVQLLVSDLRARLIERGFGGDAGDRAATVLLELLANVRDHADSPEAAVKVELRTGAIFCAIVKVFHRGSSFDLDGVLVAGMRAYEEGDREHGLAKVARLASHLELTGERREAGWVGFECFVYDLAPVGSGVFDEFDFVGPVSLEFDVPKRWRIGRDVHVGRDLEEHLAFALRTPAPRLLDLYLGGVQVPRDGYLGIEFAGHVAPSEAMWQRVGLHVDPSFPTPRSRNVVEAALEVRFRSHFASEKVVMYTFEAGFVPMGILQRWAELWGASFFTDPDALRGFLRERAP